MDIVIYARLTHAVSTGSTIVLSSQLVKKTVVHYSSSCSWLKKTSQMEKQHFECRFLLKAVVSFLLIFRKPKFFAGRLTRGNTGISNSNTGLVILKVSNQISRHIVDDMHSIVFSGRIKKTASFNRRRLNSKQEIRLVYQEVPVVANRNRSRYSAVLVIVGKRMDLLEPRFYWCIIFTSWNYSRELPIHIEWTLDR